MASSYLTHTLSTVDANGNKKGTFSAWMKRSVIGVEHVFYNVKTDANNYARFRFNDDETVFEVTKTLLIPLCEETS